MSGHRSRRKPVSVVTYLNIHAGRMKALYQEGVIESDTLEFNFEDEPIVTLFGSIIFGNNVVLNVKKFLLITNIKGKECLVTQRYSYQCHVTGQRDSEIFRYDNYHEDNPHEGHPDGHHVHRFAPPGKQVDGSPFHLPDTERPLMDEVIREAYRCSLNVSLPQGPG